MPHNRKLQFHCLHCQKAINFSLLNKQFSLILTCSHCEKTYCFDDATIVKHLRQFEALCQQIHASKEILGSTSIAIDIGNHHVKVPFNILLTRLNSVIELTIGSQRVVFSYRVEPLKEEFFSITH